MKAYGHHFSTVLGPMFCAVDDGGRTVGLAFIADRPPAGAEDAMRKRGYDLTLDALRCVDVERQTREFCEGRRREFNCEVALATGTAFQQRVWAALREIPFGTTATYGDVARSLVGDTRRSRAVGQAIGSNPCSLVVPCHRVVGVGKALTGFAWGLALKKQLLALEKQVA